MVKRTRQSIDQGAKPVKPGPKFSVSDWFTLDRLFIGGSLLLTVVIIGAMAINSMQNNYTQNIVIEGVEVITGLTAGHTESLVNYPQTPPVGGAHHPLWQQCGVYIEPVANEHAVHSLEHGAIWITYQPTLPAGQVQILQDIVVRSTHRLVSPYPGIASPIVVSAWGYQLALEDANDPRLMQFINKYEQGPQTPEPGATCNSGQRLPLSQLMRG